MIRKLVTAIMDRIAGRPFPQVGQKRLSALAAASMGNLLALLLIASSWLGVSCRKAEPPKRAEMPNAVATVAGEKITVEMLRDELSRQHRHEKQDLTTPQKLHALERLIQTDALYAKAKAAGFDQIPEIQKRIKDLIATQFREAHFSKPNPAVTEQDIEQYYRGNKARYATPASVHAAVILLEAPSNATPEKQREFRAYADSVLAEAGAATNATHFADVVRRHSADQVSRYRGGDIGWLTSSSSDADSKLLEALTKLDKPGDFAPLVPIPRGWFIAKLLERKDAGYKSLPEVKDTIRYQLARLKAQQAEADFQASIKEGLDIQINQTLLESVTLPVEKNEPPKLPGTQTAQLRH
jgi:parvulin-like peptidyl-prolyl isomerase